MRATLAYTTARILLLVVSMILLYLAGARGLLLLALAFVVSGIASFVLLSRQRDRMSGALTGRLRIGRARVGGFRSRLEAGARAEDEDEDEAADEPVGPPAGRLESADGGAQPHH
jgi:hypothetical protein